MASAPLDGFGVLVVDARPCRSDAAAASAAGRRRGGEATPHRQRRRGPEVSTGPRSARRSTSPELKTRAGRRRLLELLRRPGPIEALAFSVPAPRSSAARAGAPGPRRRASRVPPSRSRVAEVLAEQRRERRRSHSSISITSSPRSSSSPARRPCGSPRRAERHDGGPDGADADEDNFRARRRQPAGGDARHRRQRAAPRRSAGCNACGHRAAQVRARRTRPKSPSKRPGARRRRPRAARSTWRAHRRDDIREPRWLGGRRARYFLGNVIAQHRRAERPRRLRERARDWPRALAAHQRRGRARGGRGRSSAPPRTARRWRSTRWSTPSSSGPRFPEQPVSAQVVEGTRPRRISRGARRSRHGGHVERTRDANARRTGNAGSDRERWLRHYGEVLFSRAQARRAGDRT